MQVIDEAYVAEVIGLPDGAKRIHEWIVRTLHELDTAERVAEACVAQIQPLKRRAEDLLAANNRLVFEKRDLRTEMQAEIDAAHAELDEHRRNGSPDFLEVAGSPEEAAQLLAWFDQRHDLDLSWDATDDLDDCQWRVHQSYGGHNDREWKRICYAPTAIEALRLAHKAFCDGR